MARRVFASVLSEADLSPQRSPVRTLHPSMSGVFSIQEEDEENTPSQHPNKADPAPGGGKAALLSLVSASTVSPRTAYSQGLEEGSSPSAKRSSAGRSSAEHAAEHAADKKTPRKIFTALKESSPPPAAPSAPSPPAPAAPAPSMQAPALHSSLSNVKSFARAGAGVERTVESIRQSNQSINEALNNVREAKALAASRRRAATAKIKADRQAEKEEALAFNASEAAMKSELLKLRGDVGMEMIRAKAGRDKDARARKMNAIVREGEFKRERERSGKAKLKETEAHRKRMSMAARADLRENHAEGEQRMAVERDRERRRLHDEAAAAAEAKR
ncbi:hypothetical protein TeGR_g5248, partial [Tetraparma gracilis]